MLAKARSNLLDRTGLCKGEGLSSLKYSQCALGDLTPFIDRGVMSAELIGRTWLAFLFIWEVAHFMHFEGSLFGSQEPATGAGIIFFLYIVM
jgi:hypothetical protein